MILTEQHQISKSHIHWLEIDQLCFASKNLYNKCLYIIKQYYKEYETYKTDKGPIYSVGSLYQLTKESSEFRNGICVDALKSIFFQVNHNYSCYFKAKASYYKDSSKFLGLPQEPKYKPKDGRNILTYNNTTISFKKKGYVRLSKTEIYIKTNLTKEQVKEVRLIPCINHYTIEIVYEKEIEQVTTNPNRIMGIDLGVNNLVTLSSNDLDIKPVIINGRPLKSINQYYNKTKAEMTKLLSKGQKTSNSIKRLTCKRNNKIKDYMHKASKVIIQYAIDNQISTIIIGKNDGWKQEVSIGKRNNQNFVNIPHDKLIKQIQYKAELVGIEVVLTEESYTSKCSFLDMEDMSYQDNYIGKRIKRGLFKSSNKLINADLNGL